MSAPEVPKIPTPDLISDLANKQLPQLTDLLNAQATEAATALGFPAPPVLPKFVLPSLPKPGAVGPMGPLGIFGTQTQKKKTEETITLPKPTPGVEEIIS